MLIDHVSLAVADLKRSARFYDAALVPLGIVPTASGEDFRSYARNGCDDFSIRAARAEPVRPSTESHYAFAARSRAEVDAFHAAALAAGGVDNGLPNLRSIHHPVYYAALVLDPDGYRIEAVFYDRAPPG